jgi:predicted enzyme related to lactoylglutathione lyase
MAIVDKLIPGSFCWMELATTDQSAAKQFYSSLFGWTVTDHPMGPAGVYTIFSLKGQDCAAGFTIPKDELQMGVPPHWGLYIGVASADESTKLAKELGANVLAGPFDVMDKGRMSVVQDPTGAHFCLWQQITSKGIGIAGEDNTFCWADLNTPDRDAAKKFYSALLGWKFVTGKDKDESTYWHIMNGERGIGGMPPAEHQQPGAPPHWMIYYLVSDCKASFEKATSLGARGYVPPMTIEGAGEMAVLADPQGAVFALFKPSSVR